MRCLKQEIREGKNMNKITLKKEERARVQKTALEALVEIDRICRKNNIKYTLAYGTMIGAVRHQGFIPWDDDVDICMLRDDYAKFKKICETELNEKYFYQSHDTDKEYYHLYDKIRVNGTVFKEAFQADYNIHQGVYVDIFPIDYLPDNNLKRTLQYYKVRFFRTGLMAKYGVLSSRHGKKKFAARILRILYAPFSLERLYKYACKTAMRYDDKKRKDTSNFYIKSGFPREFYEDIKEVTFEGHTMMLSTHYDKMLSTIYGDYMKLPPENKRVTQHDLVEFDV